MELTWISVEEQLPPANTFIIYHAPIFETGPQMWIGMYDPEDDCFYGKSGFLGGGEVTHWMELPSVPTSPS